MKSTITSDTHGRPPTVPSLSVPTVPLTGEERKLCVLMLSTDPTQRQASLRSPLQGQGSFHYAAAVWPRC